MNKIDILHWLIWLAGCNGLSAKHVIYTGVLPKNNNFIRYTKHKIKQLALHSCSIYVVMSYVHRVRKKTAPLNMSE